MKSKCILIMLEYYEPPRFIWEENSCAYEPNVAYIDHNILLINKKCEFYSSEGLSHRYERVARITFRNDYWYWSLSPRVRCDQHQIRMMASLARNYAIKNKDRIDCWFYRLRATLKEEVSYR